MSKQIIDQQVILLYLKNLASLLRRFFEKFQTMNRILLLFLLLTLSTFSIAQNCANPMSNVVFQSGFNLIASQATNQKKLDRSLEFIAKSCLMSAQIKNIAVLFTDDSYRFEFCRAAYLSTFDQVNFFDVYDAFTSFSYSFRLYDYTRNSQQIILPIMEKPIGIPVELPKEPVVPKFANLVYPSIGSYIGNKGCEGPVADDATFNARAIQVASQPTDEAKFIAIQLSTEEACFSLAHVMKLTSLIVAEKIRLNTLMETFPRIYDQDHYMSGRGLFNSTDLQNQWVASAQFALAPPVSSVCSVEEPDMKAVLKSVQAKNFPDEKLKLLSVIKKDKCFNVAQIITFSKEFPFDKDKLDAIKMLYDGCPDKPNYFKLMDQLSFAYLRDELAEFIKSDGKN